MELNGWNAYLASTGSEFDAQHCINPGVVVGGMPVVPVLRRQRQEGHPQLHSEFKMLCLKGIERGREGKRRRKGRRE